MAAGLRVIRGPDWTDGDKDGGDGHVGTIVNLVSNGTASVVWDNGNVTSCRIGRDGKHDLRILDNATVGVRHSKICDGCTENGIAGIRWKCAQCDDVDLCSVCYVTDKHSLTHQFLRIDAPSVQPEKVQQRNKCMKVRAMGIYPGATVVRGKDWEWGNQDGGPGKHGSVVALVTPETRSARSAVTVQWDGTRTNNNYRVGHKGKVDLKYVDEAPGVEYYPHHLPVLDSTQTQLHAEISNLGEPGIQEGDKVCIELDQDALKELQKAAGSWSAGMSRLIGKVGVVKSFTQGGDVNVEFEGQKWRLLPSALRKVPKVSVGDVVRVLDDEERVKNMQEDHGGWLDVMRNVLGRSGKVVKIDSDGDIAVQFGTKVYLFNPACCEPSDDDLDDDDEDEDDDDDDDDDTLGTSSTGDQLRLQLGDGLANFIAGLALLEALSDAQQQAGTAGFIRAIVEGDMAAVKTMLQRDSDLVNAVHNGIPALQVAAHEGKMDIVKLLVEKGANKNIVDKDGDTALVLAICKEHGTIAEYLIRAGADVNISNGKNRSPVHNAAYTGQDRIVRLLIQKNCEVNAKDVGGDTALHDAIEKGHDACVDALMTSPRLNLRVANVKGFTPLHTAALKGSPSITTKLLAKNRAILNDKKEDGFTALHLAAFNDHTDVLKILMKNKADVNAKTNLSQTPLHLACEKAHVESVQLLVENGAKVNEPDKDGDTPLHIVMMGQQGGLMLRLLLGQLPRQDEESRVRIACSLIQHGASMDVRNHRNMTPNDVCSNQNIKDAVASFKRTSPDRRPMSPDGRPMLCIKCQDVRANAVYLPCGHKDTCQKCCKTVRVCGVCGKDVTRRVGEDGKKIGDDCVLQ